MTRRRASKTIPLHWSTTHKHAQVSRRPTATEVGPASERGQSRTDEADQVELDLAKGSNNDTEDNDADISKHLHVGRGNAESPGGEQGDDGVGGLQHLDEGDREVQVGDVAADQRQAEHDTDGDNGTPGRLPALASNPWTVVSRLLPSTVPTARPWTQLTCRSGWSWGPCAESRAWRCT